MYSHILFYPKCVPTRLRCISTPAHSHFQGCRAFHLIHNLFSANVNEHSRTQLATVGRKTFPRALKVSLQLVDDKSNETITVTLEQALQRLEPLSYLAEVKPGLYRIQTFPDPGPVEPVKQPAPRTNYKPYTRAGRGKEIHLTTSATPSYLRNALRISYKYILEGSRMEFHLHEKSERAKSKDDPAIDWALAHCMHLRPDSILAAMPPGTTMLATPATTDLSFKKKLPRSLHHKTSQVMWAMENAEALGRAKVVTPNRIKKLGQWPGKESSSDEVSLHSLPTVPRPISESPTRRPFPNYPINGLSE